MKTNPFALHENALRVRSLRNEMLASNLANADTPGYKARDIDFKSALDAARGGQLTLQRTSELHQNGWQSNALGLPVQYRIPVQPTLDGNTVEADVEQAQFAQNAVQYRASLSFLDGQIRSLRYAIRGSD